METEPIVISDDDDAPILQEFKAKLKEHQALHLSMCTEFDQIKSMDMEKINADTKQEKEKLYRQQVIDHFKENCNVDLQGNFEEINTPDFEDPDLVYEKDGLVLYGVDFMSTKRVIKYFRVFKVESVGWIDDSSCKVKFEDQDTVQRVIDVNKASTPIDQQIDQRRWFYFLPYYELSFQKKIQARLATNFDKVREINPKEASSKFKFYAYEQVKKRLLEQKEEELRIARQLSGAENRNPKRPYRRHQNGKFGHRNDRYCEQRQFRDYNSNGRHKRIRKQSRQQYSFVRRSRPEESPERDLEANLSFTRNEVNQSVVDDERQSRMNYSFIENPQLKQEVDREHQFQSMNLNINLSFEKRLQAGKSLVDLGLDMSKLSLNRKNLSQIDDSRQIIALDD